jgi:hypothetical protein
MHIPLRLPFLAAVLLCFPVITVAQTTAADHPSLDATEQEISSPSQVVIPGPLRSFLRMAGISQKVSPDEVLPLFARNVSVQGYIGWQEKGRPTEFLVLLARYVKQAKELSALAGAGETIRVSNCEQAMPLLAILGYRLREACGQPNAVLVTADQERAFLTADSGFPLPALEKALSGNKPFDYHYAGSRVPVLFKEGDWLDVIRTRKKENFDLVELLLRRPSLARLYWGLSREDPETRTILHRTVGLRKLLPLAPVLDFYGGNICIRDGRVQIPGGKSAEEGWKELVGASPDAPPDFVAKLLAKDNGWLAAFYDALARVNQEQQRHFTDAQHLKMYYAAFKGPDFSAGAARPAFRLAPGLLLLLTRLQWDADGQAMVPGNLQLWQEILNEKSEFKTVREWGKRAHSWDRPEQLLEAMFAFSRLDTDTGPLQIYLLFTELESQRPPERRLKTETLRLLAKRFGEYGEQYLVFSEFPELDDASFTSFVNTADALDGISNHTLRGNAMGMFQSNIGLWQILARQQQIPSAKLNQSFQAAIKPFGKIGTTVQLFDAGRGSLTATLNAATGKSRVSQDEIIELLAGPRTPGAEEQRIHQEVARGIRSVMDGQRLVSLDTLLALADGLDAVARQETSASSLLPLAGELREFEMPRPIFTSSERTEWAVGIYNNRHTELQMQTDLAKVLKSTPSKTQLEDARGELASFLRDTLVGLNYAYYEPPGAQLLRINPLFVRSHDFSGETVAGVEGLWRAPQLFGQGSPAGGGARFVGSLADLAYALSDAEQDFIPPENVQALIWREAVPSLLTDAVLPRWWDVGRNELHAVTLYQEAGEELLAQSHSNEALRAKVISILSDRMSAQKISWLEQTLQAGNVEAVNSRVTPADTFYLTAEFRRRFHDDTSWGASGQELEALVRQHPEELTWQRLSRDFGVPHRTLAQTYARQLLNIKPFPAFSGYSSRLLAESWDSNNLYWARLADEMGYAPVMLNRMVPELTRRMVGKIFATDFEDWAALLRAMRETGEEFRQGKIAIVPTTNAAMQLLN